MTLFEHLAELRTRLFRAALALVAGAAVGYILFEPIFATLIGPYCDLPQALRIGEGPECQVIALRPLEPFSVRIKTALVVGAFVAGPVIFYQLWRFIAPGLTGREKRYAIPFVIGSQVLFGAGLLFAFFIIPQGLRVLLGMGGPAITPALSATDYLSFVLTTAMAFGLVFELPLVLISLALVGIVTASGLRRFRSYAIVLNVAAAAIITPTTDPITLFALAIPMMLFYEVSIAAAWMIERRRRGRDAGDAA